MAHRHALALALMIVVGSGAPAKPVAVAPAATPFTLGTLRLTALRDMTNVVANDGSVFGTNTTPAAVAEVLKAAGAPTDQVTLGVDALLVRMKDRTILIDTGLGPKVGGVLQQSLAEAGVAPAAVTDILITHSHGDHVGGLVTATGELAFPNATIRLSSAEWTEMQAHGNKELVAAINPKVQTFIAGEEVVPGIRAVALAGHTPGHSGYEIIDGDRHLLAIGDIAHSSIVSLARPDWTIRYDGDADIGRDTRQSELAKLAASRELIFSPHFPYPGVGRIVARAGGYVFQPGMK